MDKKDQKILIELDKDPRITTSKLAKKVRISQQVADYRLKKLTEQGYVAKFGTIIDLYRLNIQQYRIFLRFKGIGADKKKKIFTFLKKHPQVYWAARIGGRFDLLIVIGVANYPSFEEWMDELYKAFPQCFHDYRANYVLTHEMYKHKYWSQHTPSDFISYGTGVDIEKIDELDWKILKQIKDNCRIPALQLAQKFKTTYKTIQNRIKKLREQKVILGERLFIKDETSPRFIVLLSYSEFSKTKEKKLFAEFREHPEITQSLHMFGTWPVFLHVRAKSSEDLQNLIIQLRERHPLIQNHEAIPVFEDILINLLPIEK